MVSLIELAKRFQTILSSSETKARIMIRGIRFESNITAGFHRDRKYATAIRYTKYKTRGEIDPANHAAV